MNDSNDDYRDLTTPENFINRTPDEQKKACLYFLRAGAIQSFHTRIDYMRAAKPDYAVDLNGADLPKSSLWQVSLSGSKLRFAVFDWSNLEEANFSGADLTGASLLGVSLYRADLRNANLSGADLRGADLTDAKLDGAVMDGVLQGDIPADRLREKPAYREQRRYAAPPKEDPGTRVGPSGGDLSSHGALEQRKYDSPVKARSDDKKPKDDSEDVMAEQIRKREEKKAELKKWHQKKRVQEKFIAKKDDNEKRALDRKKQDDLAFKRKQKEQEDALARKRREEETRRR